MQETVPMDFEGALEEFEGDEEFLMEILEGFLNSARNQIDIIRQGISEGNSEVVRKEAHAIKGGAANLIADKLSAIAHELETIGKSGTLGNESGAVLDRLEEEFHRLEAFAKDH